jgi:hypothetical protein
MQGRNTLEKRHRDIYLGYGNCIFKLFPQSEELMKLGFDLDGVLIDNLPIKRDLAFKQKNLSLDLWMLNSNVIDTYITDTTFRREIDAKSAVFPGHPITEPCIDDVLSFLSPKLELYLITARGKSQEGIDCAKILVKKHKLDTFFGNNILLVKNKEEKISKINELGLDYFIDDRKDILLDLPRSKRVLYDPFGLFKSEADSFYLLSTLNELKTQFNNLFTHQKTQTSSKLLL